MLDIVPTNLWAAFEICGLPHETSIAKIGELDAATLAALQSEDLGTCDMGWPPELDAKNRALAKQYGFDAAACIRDVKGNLFVELGTPENTDPFRDALVKLFPDLADREVDIGSFHAYFAHLHKDDHFSRTRGQFNIILENNAGHRLLSVDDEGQHHVMTPAAGDVIFLDIFRGHAVLPDQSNGIRHMRQNPMKAMFLTIDPSFD